MPSASPHPIIGRRSEPDHREPGSAPRWRLGVGAVVVAVLALLGVGVVLSARAAAGGGGAEQVPPVAVSSGPGGGSGSRPGTDPSPSAPTVFVHILGQVARPGLYEVAAGSRAVDVVAAAGGFGPRADQHALNLARPVVDGEQIVVPKPGESPAPVLPAPSAGGVAGSASPGGGTAAIDLNTADLTALQTLPGVGPATAQAILDWRAENGPFRAVDDLLDVTGIGEKKLDRLRDAVRVG
jgi:competence protein ComEA